MCLSFIDIIRNKHICTIHYFFVIIYIDNVSKNKNK